VARSSVPARVAHDWARRRSNVLRATVSWPRAARTAQTLAVEQPHPRELERPTLDAGDREPLLECRQRALE